MNKVNFDMSEFIKELFQNLPEFGNKEKLRIIFDAQNYMKEIVLDELSNMGKILSSHDSDIYSKFLVCCPELDKVFCVLCICFGNKQKYGPKSGLMGHGMKFNNMVTKHLKYQIKYHVASKIHTEALEEFNRVNSSTDVEIVDVGKSVTNQNKNIQENRHVLTKVLNTVIFLVSAGIDLFDIVHRVLFVISSILYIFMHL